MRAATSVECVLATRWPAPSTVADVAWGRRSSSRSCIWLNQGLVLLPPTRSTGHRTRPGSGASTVHPTSEARSALKKAGAPRTMTATEPGRSRSLASRQSAPTSIVMNPSRAVSAPLEAKVRRSRSQVARKSGAAGVPLGGVSTSVTE